MNFDQNGSKSDDDLLTPREVTYQESLILVTHMAGIIAGILFSFFILLYWIIDFPRITVLVNIASLMMDVAGLVLITRFHVHKPAAHLFTFAAYFSLIGTTFYTGGIDGSSMVWLAFLPIAATIMAGTTDGLVWGVISVSTIAGMYVLNRSLGINVTLLPSTSLDRMIDLIAVTSVTGTAIWLNEKAKARAMNDLEGAQALLHHMAWVDPLTNVFNRRYFFDRAKIELELARPEEGRTSILLLDIDHFKNINDSYGHHVGDQILTGLVAVCQENLREIDTLARLGGEEFVILLPETEPAQACYVAERLRSKIEHTSINTDSGLLTVTVSIGVMSHPTSDVELPVHKLVQRADQAMYLAKRSGRNRVVTWQSQESRQSTAE